MFSIQYAQAIDFPPRALLGLLLRGERHGNELKRIVDQAFSPHWRIDFAQLYRSLAEMAAAWNLDFIPLGDERVRPGYSARRVGIAAHRTNIVEIAQQRITPHR